ncbi:hypothetical protein EI94DRAFT_1090849 [Lactarius quietus]|nr:hypothetical protein EI94DRAFT_1090849 [Lactarius quietus]
MAKTHTMLHMAERDGPLLNFLKLGQLGTMAVPFIGSGLEAADFVKLQDLMQEMTEDPQLPMTDASTPIWKDLGRLREEVADICASSRNEDKANMQALLAKIDEVNSRRPPTQEHRGHRPSDSLQGQPSRTSPVMRPNTLAGGAIARNATSSSYASSTSTTVIEDQCNSSPVQEKYCRGPGITDTPSNISRGEFANVYRTPYPLFPSPIVPSGTITPPFSASIWPTSSPLFKLGSTDVSSPGIPSNPSIRHVRSNSQHKYSSVYYPPRGDTPATWPLTMPF